MSTLKPPAPPEPLHYWPYCGRCRRPFEFDKNEPFAYCGCPGAAEWGNPRPAEWVPDPQKAPVLHAKFETTDGVVTGTTAAPMKRIEANEDGSFTVVIDHWPQRQSS
jgi:hypothetical protein